MYDFQRKKRIRNIVYSPVFLIIISIIFIFLAKGVYGVYKKQKISMDNLKKEQLDNDKLNIRKENLATSIEFLKTEQGIESEIRAKFRAVKDGENISVIIDNTLPPIRPATTTSKGFFYNLFH